MKAAALLLSATLQSRGLQLERAVAPPTTEGAPRASEQEAGLFQETTTSSRALDSLEAPQWPETTEKIFVPGLSPTEAGCLVRTPAGCPKHPAFASSDWRHAEFGSRYTSETDGRVQCEVHRKAYLAKWCGVEVVETLFIPAVQDEMEEQAEVTPTEPGCFLRTPWGCPLEPSLSSKVWREDEDGEGSAEASVSRPACEVGRRAALQRRCGADLVETAFVPWPQPGCYVRAPSGCPAAAAASSLSAGGAWARVGEGEEEYSGAELDRGLCEVYVERQCGSLDVEIKFIPPDWESLLGVGDEFRRHNDWGIPAEPGCYLRTPTGCPRAPTFNTSSWRRDAHFSGPASRMGPTAAAAGALLRSACETGRRSFVAEWCGADDVEALFVPRPEPGCYFRAPSGCPEHPSFGSRTWKQEGDGEQRAGAETNRTVCKVDRKADLQQWCGTEDFEMLFIPALRQ